ncbi:MAG: cytochrome c family protein [Desulfuromonadales bacterium]|nr:cytochrome c family protein [Desulfuromonadales bacterium]
MKKVISAVILTMFCSSFAFADDGIIVFTARNGNVAFPHEKHKQMIGDCKKCHTGAPGKIEGFNMQMAHQLCKGCHVERKAGPTQCGGCHKK